MIKMITSKKAEGIFVLLCLTLSVMILPTGLFCQLLLTDDFSGYAGNLATNTGGLPSSIWTKSGTGPHATIMNANPLNYTGYIGGGGNYVQMPEPSGSTSRVFKSFTSTTAIGNTFFCSFLLRLSSATSDGDYFISLGDPTTGTVYGPRIFAKSSGSGFILGVSKQANSLYANYGSTLLNFEQTYLIVFRYSAILGTNNDLTYLWINPSISSEPYPGSAECSAIVSTDPFFTGGNVGNFHWHNRSLNNPVGAFDGVRVAVGNTSASAWCNLFQGNAGQWVSKPNFPIGKEAAASFSIGAKGYVGTGTAGVFTSDFWEFDPATNAWTQKADFGGVARTGAVGFSIGDRGYIGTGFSNSWIDLNDLWEYNPTSNVWVQKASFLGAARRNAVGFAIGENGYIGLGQGGFGVTNDFWKYNQSTNSWSQVANFAGAPRFGAASFVLNNRAYVGTGSSFTNDFWEYDPSLNSWISKANFPGNPRMGAVGFSVNGEGYLGIGGSTDFWSYRPSSNSWSSITTFNGGPVQWGIGFSTNDNKGYVGIGLNGGQVFSAYEPLSSQIIQTEPITLNLSQGTEVSVPFTIGCNSFSAGNVFTAQLSGSDGSFANPVNIGSLSGIGSGVITGIIPSNTTSGNLYRIRVVGSNPSVIGVDNGQNLSIYPSLVINSFSPISAKPGDVVNISGTGFDTNLNNNIVFFGATKATVLSANETNLAVMVPYGATFSPITLLNNQISRYCTSQNLFNPVYAPVKSNILTNDFSSNIDFIAGNSPENSILCDIDGDGKSDVIVPNYSSNTISIYRNISIPGSINAMSLAPKVDFMVGNGPVSVASGDLDFDGKPDLIVSNNLSNTVSVLKNVSILGEINQSSFSATFNISIGSQPKGVVIGDLNNDGKPEIIVSTSGNNAVSVLANKSSTGILNMSSFAANVEFPVAFGGAHSLALGDLDLDGKMDIITVNFSANSISVLRNISTGNITSASFAQKVDFNTGQAPISIALGDLDGDGKLDISIVNVNSTSVSIFRNISTTGTFNTSSLAARVDFSTGLNPQSVAIGDIDGDSKSDLVVANTNGFNVSVWKNIASNGSFSASSLAPRIDIPAGSSQPFHVTIGDLDGDSRPDFVLTNRSSNSISVLRNNDLAPVIASFSPISAKPGDLVNIIGTGFNSTAANNVVYFGATRATVTSSSATSLTVEVPTGAIYAPITLLNTSSVLACSSLGNFNPVYAPAKNNISSSDFQPKVDFSTGTEPYSVAIGDMDGDGKPDLVLVNNGAHTVSVLRNTSSVGNFSSGSFAPKVDFNTGINPIFVDLGDVDGDGKLDIVCANMSSNSVSILRNTSSVGSISSSSFAPKVDFATGNTPWCVTLCDLDGDGKLDLAAANWNSSTVSVMRNTSVLGSITASSFTPKVDFATSNNPWSINSGDLDSDGKPDLVAVTLGGALSVLRNLSSRGNFTLGSFAPKVDFLTGATPRSVAIGDIDGDYKPDLVVANQSGSVSVFRNTASLGNITPSSFADKVDFVAGSGPYSVSIGDLDGDGKPDLAVANSNSNTVSVLRNTATIGTIGLGSFADKVDFATGSYPFSVGIGDLDADGKPDLSVANFLSSTVSVIRNADLPPLITSFAPTSGCQGSSITITGSNFTDAVAVSIGGIVLGSFTVNSETEISAIVNEGNSGTIEVITPFGSGSSNSSFSLNPNITWYLDADNDGYYTSSQLSCSSPGLGWTSTIPANGANDCNDNNALLNTITPETCNNFDDDCDGTVDNGLTFVNYYNDADGDGYGAGTATSACQSPGASYVTNNTDCNDGNALLNSISPEICNNFDDDCDGTVDNGLNFVNYYNDQDGDGFGSGTATSACQSPGASYVTNTTDCNDGNALLNSISPEICNNFDDDCDGTVDNGLNFVNYYNDQDGDGYGAGTATNACSQPANTVTNNTDCNDNNAALNSITTETCNNFDDDCDGTVDNGLVFVNYYNDSDGDGYGAGTSTNACQSPGASYVTNNTDCNDGNASLNTITTETCNNFDDDCDGTVDNGLTFVNYYNDADGDGFGSGTATSACQSPGASYVTNNTDCNDGNAAIQPGATEICGNNIDEDCSGSDLICPNNGSFTTTNVVSVGNYGTGSQTTLSVNFAQGADNVESPGSGIDRWYQFTAQANAMRIELIGNTTVGDDNDIALYDYTTATGQPLIPLVIENDVTPTNMGISTDGGNEILYYDQLEAGSTYWICLRNLNSVYGTTTLKLAYLRGSAMDIGPYTAYTNTYNNTCQNFKCKYKPGASYYTFNLWNGNIAQGPATWIYSTTPTTTTVATTVVQLGRLVGANINNAPVQHTVKVDTHYALKDAYGHTEQVVGYGVTPGVFTMNTEADLNLRTTDRCPVYKSPTTGSMATNRSVCGTTRYIWELTMSAPTSGLPQVVNGPVGGSRVLAMSTIPGIANNQQYGVAISSLHVDQQTQSNYGTSQCMRTYGFAGAPIVDGNENENERAGADEQSAFNIELFPNPNGGDRVVLNINGLEGETTITITDAMGREIEQLTKYIEGDYYQQEITFQETLSSGLYQMIIKNGAQVQSIRMVVSR